jgi:hypothetical protein
LENSQIDTFDFTKQILFVEDREERALLNLMQGKISCISFSLFHRLH